MTEDSPDTHDNFLTLTDGFTSLVETMIDEFLQISERYTPPLPPQKKTPFLFNLIFFSLFSRLKFVEAMKLIKDMGHLWLGYIRMLGHPQMSAHLSNFEGIKAPIFQSA